MSSLLAAATREVAAPSRAKRVGRSLRRQFGILLGAFLIFNVLGNAVILGASAWAQRSAPDAPVVLGVGNFIEVDGHLSRGKAPTEEGYASLAGRGVATIIDLRAEDDAKEFDNLIGELGMSVVHVPIRDGQSPSESQVAKFLTAVKNSPGPVFVHCGAGVGRTGVMAAAWLVSTGEADGWSAMQRNLEVGPPSLEQLAFAAGLDSDEFTSGKFDRPGPLVVAISRTLDAPRRIWHNLGL